MLHAKALPSNPYDGHTLATTGDEDAVRTGRAVATIALVDIGALDRA